MINFKHKYWIAAIEFPCIIAAILILLPRLGWWGSIGLFFAFVGFELHLIYHRIEREEKAQKRLSEKKDA